MAYKFNPFTGTFDISSTTDELDGEYVNVSGDTMTGSLTIDQGGLVNSVFNINGATDSYIRSTATDLFQIGHAGTQRITITSAGNVGVGEALPAYVFDVKGNSGSQFRVRENNNVLMTVDSAMDDLSIGTISLGDISGGVTGAYLHIDMEVGEASFVDASLAVNTSTPDKTLHVNGDSKLDGVVEVGTTSGRVIIGDVSGNARGATALDIQKFRVSSAQVASGNYSTAIGSGLNTASGYSASAVGFQNTASGSRSMAAGYSNLATTQDAIAFGFANGAYGNTSNAIGSFNTANDLKCSAIGENNTASGMYSVAIGGANTATGGFGSTSTGHSNANIAAGATAVGFQNNVEGAQSTVVGRTSGTTAAGSYSVVVGANNTSQATKASILGSDITNSTANSVEIGPSNSAKMSIASDGDVVAAGSLTAGGTTSGQSTIASGLVVNEGGGNGTNDDFRVETATQGSAFLVDASADEVQINTTFIAHRESAASEPTLSTGEMKIWRDSANNKVYLVYNDTDEGQHKVELI